MTKKMHSPKLDEALPNIENVDTLLFLGLHLNC